MIEYLIPIVMLAVLLAGAVTGVIEMMLPVEYDDYDDYD